MAWQGFLRLVRSSCSEIGWELSATATIQELDFVRPVAVCSTAFFAEMAPDIILSL
jgi:hypothetical protein